MEAELNDEVTNNLNNPKAADCEYRCECLDVIVEKSIGKAMEGAVKENPVLLSGHKMVMHSQTGMRQSEEVMNGVT